MLTATSNSFYSGRRAAALAETRAEESRNSGRTESAMRICLLLSSLALASFSTVPSLSQLSKKEELERFHKPVQGMSASVRMAGYEKRLSLEAGSPFRNIRFRCVGPEIQGGRIVDIEVPDGTRSSLLVAFATGGLWRTDNMGTTWTSLFDRESAMTIGDIAVAGEGGTTLWLGSGESNSSRTSYAGTGVFKSTDGGKSWVNTGLHESHHIGRIVVDPKNADRVFVAAVGHLYSWNDERGIYRTTDGGKSWKRVLFVDNMTGGIDLAMDPTNSNVLYAAMWQRDRRAWNFLESGVGSGLYKSTDGGETWTKLRTGLPEGEYLGRIGISICATNPSTVYVVVDNQAPAPGFDRQDEGVPSGELTERRLRFLTDSQLLEIPDDVLQRFLSQTFPPDLTAARLKAMVREGTMSVQKLLGMLGDANADLFEARIQGAQLYRSDDGGASWKQTTTARLDSLYNTYGYYFGQVRVSPTDPDTVFLLGVPIMRSTDGGRSFASVGGRGVHADHHALWIDPRWPDRVALGNDGGLNLSWDGGRTWQKVNNLPVGQFTTIAVDMAQPYRIYGGLQDNGTMRGPSTYVPGASDPWEWEDIGGGDGGTVAIDVRDNETVITSSQFGFTSGRNRKTGESWNAMPRPQFGDSRLRYNWVTPFLLSPHHPDVLYYGANRVYRSFNQGRSYLAISPDLTKNLLQGDVPYGTIKSLSESPLAFGVLYVGTDDGRVWRSSDSGANWIEIGQSLAPGKWVSRIAASAHRRDCVYLAKSGYREDDFAPYLWRSDDGGSTWRDISAGLPAEPINVVAEDPVSPDIVFVGTDMGVFVSLDRGATWEALEGGLPHTPVHDLVVHPREGDLVLGTHGRSVWVASVSVLRSITPEVRRVPVHIFPIASVVYDRMWAYRTGGRGARGSGGSIAVTYWLRSAGSVTATIMDSQGRTVKSEPITGEGGRPDPGEHGLNFGRVSLQISEGRPIPPGGIDWKPTTLQDILKDPYEDYRPKYLGPGTYRLVLESGASRAEATFEVRAPN